MSTEPGGCGGARRLPAQPCWLLRPSVLFSLKVQFSDVLPPAPPVHTNEKGHGSAILLDGWIGPVPSGSSDIENLIPWSL